MQRYSYTLSFLLICFSSLSLAASPDKILIIVSNQLDMGDQEKHDARNNLWEVAPPYHVFLMHGYDVDFMSPNGGKVEFSMDPVGISYYAIKYENFLQKATQSLHPDAVKSSQYVAAYIGGGYGTLFDVASDQKSLELIAQIYQQGGLVGATGHGPGAFANVKLSSGEYMVKDKKVAGFPNSTEITKSWANQGKLLPFMVESQLAKNGAITINKSNIENKTDVIVDQRLVTTMFLPSAAAVAKEMVDLLAKASVDSKK